MACGATLSLKRSLEFDPVHSPDNRGHKRRRCMPLTMSPSLPPTKSHDTEPSPFAGALPKLTQEQIAVRIGQEIRRMQRRGQLPRPTKSGGSSSSDENVASQPIARDLPSMSMSNPILPRKDLPLFTFKQMTLVCERMVKEREAQIREEYDKVLTCKLAEQYESFLKFNHDQLRHQFSEAAASYFS